MKSARRELREASALGDVETRDLLDREDELRFYFFLGCGDMGFVPLGC
jgi:hypothetical protein